MVGSGGSVATLRLLPFITPTPAEIDFMSSAPAEDRQVEPEQTIYPHDRGEGLFVLLEGWVASSIVWEDGRERINSIKLPGDPVAMAAFVLATPSDRTFALTRANLRWYPGSLLKDMFVRHPRLAATMLLITQEERAARGEWNALHAVSARTRFAAFLFRIGERMRKLAELIGHSLDLPLTQRQVAEAVGVTPVYVHQLIAGLRQENLIEHRRGVLRILDLEGLQRICGLAAWDVVTPTWLPPPAP